MKEHLKECPHTSCCLLYLLHQEGPQASLKAASHENSDERAFTHISPYFCVPICGVVASQLPFDFLVLEEGPVLKVPGVHSLLVLKAAPRAFAAFENRTTEPLRGSNPGSPIPI